MRSPTQGPRFLLLSMLMWQLEASKLWELRCSRRICGSGGYHTSSLLYFLPCCLLYVAGSVSSDDDDMYV